ncbi:uncharacterized protein LOC134453794 [Engraulis encrasicolus]|uniref:uncharacterized protein LOC134453794 n=1 Tax=Engraulis encrasicolus TaxID=184585 RepID=UPI002FD11E17
MSATAKKNESLVWTDDEVELLLRVTLEYKTTRYQENVDWESCQSKYQDIGNAFRDRYPRDAAPAGKEFPHEPSTITKAQITAKLKAVRNKYRHAVDSGRQSGHGLIFFELCHEIWGGTPATTGISSGFESGDLVEETSPSSPRSVSPAPTVDREAEVVCRRNLLQEKLKNHRTDRLKRKVPAEASENEDKQYRKRVLELMESCNTRLGTTQ